MVKTDPTVTLDLHDYGDVTLPEEEARGTKTKYVFILLVDCPVSGLVGGCKVRVTQQLKF